MADPQDRVTALLARGSEGDRDALDELVPLIYEDLRRIARGRLRAEPRVQTLDTTALVHEAYLRLVNPSVAGWRDRAHFFALASRVMRHLLVDYVRRKQADKRGGPDRVRVPLQERMAVEDPRYDDLLMLDEALSVLAERDARMEKVVECRFFGGMTVEETAEALDVSSRTVERDWTRAKAYLHRALSPDEDGAAGAEGRG